MDRNISPQKVAFYAKGMPSREHPAKRGRPPKGGTGWPQYLREAEDAAIIALGSLADRRGIPVKEVARLANIDFRTFGRKLEEEDPSTISAIARVLKIQPIAIRAIRGAINDRDESQANRFLAHMIVARKRLFKNALELHKEVRELFVRLDKPIRRSILAKFIAVSAGLQEGEPFDVLGENLTPYGVSLEKYYARDQLLRYREASISMHIFFDSLALPFEVRENICKIINPFFVGYDGWLNVDDERFNNAILAEDTHEEPDFAESAFRKHRVEAHKLLAPSVEVRAC